MTKANMYDLMGTRK